MLLFEFDVCEPWLDTTGVTQQILLIHDVLIGLEIIRSEKELASKYNAHSL